MGTDSAEATRVAIIMLRRALIVANEGGKRRRVLELVLLALSILEGSIAAG